MLAVVYLIFNEGYGGRGDLAAEAIRLQRALASLMRDEAEVHGLLALMLVNDAPCQARFADTPIPPYETTTALVTDGPFRLTRNPAYLAFALTYLGIALLADAPGCSCLCPWCFW